MISAQFDDKQFYKDMNNIIEYSLGFVEGVRNGKNAFLRNIGKEIKQVAQEYIDSIARTNPMQLHHVYEWYQTGSPNARLFEINYTVSNQLGLSFRYTFSQSRSMKQGSTVPFYDKARIMEEGIPVVIKPVQSNVLVFDDNGEEVFTKKPILVEDPGGTAVQGGFQEAFDSFFNSYFTQAFMEVSGIAKELRNPVVYSRNLNSGRIGGGAVGRSVGQTWIANLGGKGIV